MDRGKFSDNCRIPQNSALKPLPFRRAWSHSQKDGSPGAACLSHESETDLACLSLGPADTMYSHRQETPLGHSSRGREFPVLWWCCSLLFRGSVELEGFWMLPTVTFSLNGDRC